MTDHWRSLRPLDAYVPGGKPGSPFYSMTVVAGYTHTLVRMGTIRESMKVMDADYVAFMTVVS